MKYLRNIVPIYMKEDFSGTGFFYKSLLITANHVVADKLHSYFLFEGNLYNIDINECILLDTPGNIQSTSEKHDLFVCKTSLKCEGLNLISEYDKTQTCEYFGYSFNEDSKKLVVDSVKNIHITHDFSYNDFRTTKFKNCLTCQCVLRPGNSGGPIFQNDNVIGMLVSGYNEVAKCTFIKASYILKLINLTNNSEY